ncbi:MAG: hypothetical protein ACRDWA_09675 [Acidimicrobiia bacterium]
MMNSMLGLILLGGSTTGADEMNARPGPDGGYGALDEILARFAREPSIESESDQT